MNAFTIPIIYQDHHLLIVNKPAGIVIHPTYKNTEGTLWDHLLDYLHQQGDDDWQPPQLPDHPQWARAPQHIQDMLRQRRIDRLWQEEGLLPRPILLHRLDKDTSGIVALARTARFCRHIVRQFHDHTIIKRYLAVVQRGAPDWAHPRAPFTATWQRHPSPETHPATKSPHPADHHDAPAVASLPFQPFPPDEELYLTGPLQRDPRDRRRCIIGPDGQDAITALRVLAADDTFALLAVRPISGRTHQIRAHLAAFGYAIVGDKTYGLTPQSGTPQSALARQFLHAHSLELNCYPDNERRTFVAPPADDLLAWLEHYFPTASGALHARNTLPT